MIRCATCDEEIRPHYDLDGSIAGYVHVESQIEWNSDHQAKPDAEEDGR